MSEEHRALWKQPQNFVCDAIDVTACLKGSVLTEASNNGVERSEQWLLKS